MLGKINSLVLLATVLSFATIVLCQTQPAASGEAPQPSVLVGLWGTEQILAPAVAGELTIDGRGAEWRASITGFDAAVERKAEAISVVLPANHGEFRGHIKSSRILGHWIQAGSTYPYNQRYASPVELAEVQAKVWRGKVIPLESKISFYVAIQRSGDGKLTAFMRNPEANVFRRRSYTVELRGKIVALSREGEQIEGSYDDQADELTLPLLDSQPPLRLTRRKRDNAPGFYPRSSEDKYVYRQPIAEKDGWSTASLVEVGIDARPITAMIEKILSAERSSDTMNIQSFLIARHGKLVLEEYFYGFDKNRPHDMRSASKTFAPMLVGIARDHGAKVGLETPVYSLFPEYKPFANWDERKAKLTLRDLMTMTSGLACDDGDESSPGQEDRMQSQTEQPDWYKYTLDLPMAKEPGGDRAIYCSAQLNLVGGVARNASGKWLPELFDEYFARPLEITSYYMNLMPTGEAYSGGGLYMRARDQLKLGQLFLNGGVWNGHRIVDADWVNDSVARHATFPRPVIDIDVNHGYGYGWHIRDLKSGGRVFRDYYAGGNGGQNVIVIPDLDMVIGFTGGSYGEANKFFRWELELVPQYIIPAAISGANGAKRPSQAVRKK